MNATLTAEAKLQLQDGINLLLKRWAALQMAVENQWGGSDSAEKPKQLATDLFDRLANTKIKNGVPEPVYMDDLEEMLEVFMDTLNTEVGDGSIEEIAEKLMYMREECLEGDYSSIQRLRETNTPNVSYASQSGNNDEEDSEGDDGDDNHDLREDDGMEVDVASNDHPSQNRNRMRTNEPSRNAGPEVVDGWTVVSSKRNKGRRN